MDARVAAGPIVIFHYDDKDMLYLANLCLRTGHDKQSKDAHNLNQLPRLFIAFPYC